MGMGGGGEGKEWNGWEIVSVEIRKQLNPGEKLHIGPYIWLNNVHIHK